MKTLLDALNLPDNDIWYDDGCDYARSLMDAEAPYIFTELLEHWKTFSELQQEHLAYILDEGSSELEDSLIRDMMSSPSKEVSFKAWEAKNNSSGEQDAAGNPLDVE